MEIEICRESSIAERGQREMRIKTCGEIPCGFYDAETISEDMKDRSMSKKKISVAILLGLIFMGVEVVGGIEANSLALLTDAAHLLSDVACFAVSIFSLWASGWEATPRRSYGYFRIEILVNLASILLIWALTGWIVYEAITRLSQKNRETKGSLMFGVASFGLVVNLAMVFLFGHGHHDHDHHNEEEDGGGAEVLVNNGSSEVEAKKKMNINVQGAYLHAIVDLIQSVGVMISAGFIWWKPKWEILDLICTMIFAVLVMVRTISTTRKLLDILMETAPREIDCTRLAEGLCDMEEVISIHELHVWAITVGKVCLACHVKIKPEADTDAMLDKVVEYIKRQYKIKHVTIQVEREQNP